MPNAEKVEEMEFLPLGEPAPDTKDTGVDTSTDTKTEEDTEDKTVDENIENNTDEESTDTDDNKDTNSEDEEKNNNDGDQENIYKQLIESQGVEFEEEELEDLLNTETTTEGFNKVASAISDKKAQSKIDAWMEQYPHAANMMQYEQLGGDPKDYMDTFFPETDYSEMSVSENDVSQQKDIVRASMNNQGLEKEDIDAEIKDLEDAGLLKNRAERSLKILKSQQEQRQQDFEKQQKEMKQQRQQEYEQHYNNVSSVIDDNKIPGLNIPEKQKNKFKEYIFEPVDDQGNTQAALDSQQMDMNQRMFLTYLNFSGKKLSEVISDKAGNKKVTDIMNAINKSENNDELKGNNKRKVKSDDPNNIVEF